MYVRAFRPAEQAGRAAGLRSSNAFTLRRSQILLASHRGQHPAEIARNLGCATQTVRNTLHAFEQRGLACLKPQPLRPQTIHAQLDQQKCEALQGHVKVEASEIKRQVISHYNHTYSHVFYMALHARHVNFTNTRLHCTLSIGTFTT